MKKLRIAGVVLALIAFGTATLTATGTADSAKRGKRVFGLTYWAASDFFETIANTVKAAAEANGDEVIIIEAQQDNLKQLNIIEDFITRGVDAVFLNPVDRDAIKPALVNLRKAIILQTALALIVPKVL